MTKNPFINAALALGYVIAVVSLISFGPTLLDAPKEDNILMPIGMISLLTLSTAMMAYLFFYQPLMMFFENKRAEAVKLFLHTVAIFACFTLCVFVGAMLLFK